MDSNYVNVRVLIPAVHQQAPSSQLKWIGRLTGILSPGLLAFSAILGGVKKADGAMRARVHCAISWFALTLSVYHGIMLAVGPYSSIQFTALMNVGYASAGLMAASSVNGASSEWLIRKTGYRAWLNLHRLLITPATVLVLYHGIMLGTDLQPRRGFLGL